MKEYIANVELDSELKKIEFKTNESPVEYLWKRYGMDAYIEYVSETHNDTEEKIKE